MPPRKKENEVPSKMMIDKLNLKKTTLSKSQKRKLKKLEEEKERELLSAKTSELLDEFKISEDVSSLYQSSKAIGRTDTNLEKRMRPMQRILSDETNYV
ncbi:hypothetical protein HA466_0307050 [Hirschfeldia incana]|nr:hypothetical protein HA466_0307050 [Hirschfeldia incana]